MPAKECKCLSTHFQDVEFTRTDIGIDSTDDRYGEVSFHRCNGCDRVWLHYLVEYEAFTRSGRWFRGLIDDSDMATVTPENAVSILDRLEWHFCGGSFFGSISKRRRQKIEVGLYS